jgi:hypothetical protein
LVAAGLVHREPEPGDRRVVRLRLTQAGEAAIGRAAAAYPGWLDGLLAATGDADQIRRDLALLDRALDERWHARLSALTGQHDQAANAERVSDPVSNQKTPALAKTAGSAGRAVRKRAE